MYLDRIGPLCKVFKNYDDQCLISYCTHRILYEMNTQINHCEKLDAKYCMVCVIRFKNKINSLPVSVSRPSHAPLCTPTDTKSTRRLKPDCTQFL